MAIGRRRRVLLIRAAMPLPVVKEPGRVNELESEPIELRRPPSRRRCTSGQRKNAAHITAKIRIVYEIAKAPSRFPCRGR